MKTRTLLWLLLAAIALSLAAAGLARRRAVAARPDARAGAPLVAFDINRVAALRIQSGTNTVAVVRRDGRWIVETLHGYPADFERLTERLRDLAEIKIGQVAPGGAEDLAEFGLDAAGAAAVVDFEDAAGARLGRLTLGRTRESRGGGPFGGFPDGQYARMDEGPVVLLGRVISGFRGDARDWIQTDLLSVAPAAGASVEITVGGETCRLRVGEGGKPEMEGLAEQEELDEGMARRAVGALQYLHFLTVGDPGQSEETFGLTAPDRYVFRAADGFIYTILLGAAREGGTRFIRASVAYERPAPSPAAENADAEEPASPAAGVSDEAAERNARRAAEEQERLAKWTYEISAWNAESLAMPRAKLIKSPPVSPAEATPAQEDAAAADAPRDPPAGH